MDQIVHFEAMSWSVSRSYSIFYHACLDVLQARFVVAHRVSGIEQDVATVHILYLGKLDQQRTTNMYKINSLLVTSYILLR